MKDILCCHGRHVISFLALADVISGLGFKYGDFPPRTASQNGRATTLVGPQHQSNEDKQERERANL
jgi:hypothetical protein